MCCAARGPAHRQARSGVALPERHPLIGRVRRRARAVWRRVQRHADSKVGVLDVAADLDARGARSADVYSCGPAGLLDAVEAYAADRPGCRLRVERSAAAAGPPDPAVERGFVVKIADGPSRGHHRGARVPKRPTCRASAPWPAGRRRRDQQVHGGPRPRHPREHDRRRGVRSPTAGAASPCATCSCTGGRAERYATSPTSPRVAAPKGDARSFEWPATRTAPRAFPTSGRAC